MPNEEVTIVVTQAESRFGWGGGAWRVQMGDRWHDELTWDEMLGVFCRLTCGGTIDPNVLRTADENRAVRQMWMTEAERIADENNGIAGLIEYKPLVA